MLQLERVLYQVFISTYGFIIRVASIFNPKAKKWIKGRASYFELLEKQLRGNDIQLEDQTVWIHCSSLGEFEQGRPLIEKVKQEFQTTKVVLTFFSPSGYEIRKSYNQADVVAYMPLDTRSNAKHFIELINPALAIFVKYEFWLNHIETLQNKSIPVYLISSIFRKSQPFFKWHGAYHRHVLRGYTEIFTQNEESKKLLSKIKVNQVTVAPDTRFDRVAKLQTQSFPVNNPSLDVFKGKNHLLVAGSTWEEDEHRIVAWINEALPYDWKVVIAPHEISEKNLIRLEQSLKKPNIRYSKMKVKNIQEMQVLIIDNIGLLMHLYGLGKIAYVGGGFNQGIHNILEPAAYGLPVIFGPNYKKFNEAVELIQLGGAATITSSRQLKEFLNYLIYTKGKLAKRSLICSNYVRNNVGGTSQIFERIKHRLESL